VFDCICGIGCLLGIVLSRKTSLIGVAAYFFSHSFGHYNAAALPMEEGSMQVKIKDMIVLAAILSIGPLTSVSELIKVDKVGKNVGNACAMLGLGAGVAVYVIFLKKPCYVLLYINIFIILAISLPRCFLIGCTSEKDVEIRASKFRWESAASGLMMMAAIFCEPFYCDTFISYIGGHAVFDFALAVNLLVRAVLEEGVSHEITSKKAD
jgi:hypothetical protein